MNIISTLLSIDTTIHTLNEVLRREVTITSKVSIASETIDFSQGSSWCTKPN